MSKTKYHINSSGERAICRAFMRSCPLGGSHLTRAEVIVEQNKLKEGHHPFYDIADQLATDDQPHYRVYLSENKNEPVVINMQRHDYYDSYYDGSRFLNSTAYLDEEQAEVAAKLFNDEETPSYLKKKYSPAETKVHSQAGKDSYSAFTDVVDQLETYDQPHYRVYLSTKTNQPTTICVQSLDYHDYKGSHFLDDKAYLNEEQAEVAAKNFNKTQTSAWNPERATAEEIVDHQAGKDSYSAFTDVVDQLETYGQVHYRTYFDSARKVPTTVCVQDFDYHDYKGSHFLDSTAYASEQEAEDALKKFNVK